MENEENMSQKRIVQYFLLDDEDRNAGAIIMVARDEARYLSLMLMKSAIPGKELEFTESYLQEAVKLVCDCYGGFVQEMDIYADYLAAEAPSGEL